MERIVIDPRNEARQALSDLLDRIAFLALTLGVVTTVIGLVRVTSRGWHANVITDLLFFIAIVVVVLLRAHIPVGVVFSLLLGLVAAMSLAGFVTLGLATSSFVGLAACCLAIGVVFGKRAGFWALGGFVVAVGAIGAAVCRGFLTGLQVTDPFLLEPQTWVSQLAGFAGFTAVILVVSGALQSRLSNTLMAVSRQAEELRESEGRYRLLADNMRDVLFLQNLDFGLEYVSPSAERLFGYTMGEFLEINAQDTIEPGSRERAAESFQHALAMAEDGEFEVPPQEFEYLRKDGSTFWGEVTATFLRDSDGKIVGIQGLLRDITVRKQIEGEREELERELRQAEKLKAIGQLAGGIAHDFNNQLTSIMAHADLLRRSASGDASIADRAKKILTPARNAAELTGKLLAFARKGTYEHRPVDMHDVINEVAEILSHGIDRRIKVKRHYEADSAVVEGDRTQLQNVFLNLGLNARDAMPDGGEIVFRTQQLDPVGADPGGASPHLSITVSDTGCGMDDNVRERAFEPFFTTKSPGKGTGMGLSAAYGTVVSHGGRIGIDSRPGGGTEVFVHLPLSLAPAADGPDSRAERILLGPGRVLVIDDDDSVRAALCDLLESLGCTAEGFDRAATAVDVYRRSWREVELVVLDLVLSDATGREVLELLRGINPEVRVLLVSGYTADDEIHELQRADTIEFLEKPFLLADLAESLTRLMGSH